MSNFDSPIGRPFLDKLLLAIIDAHPDPLLKGAPATIRANREARLHAARSALLATADAGRLPVHDDRVLRWMGQQLLRDRFLVQQSRGTPDENHGVYPHLKKERSIRQLAQEACTIFALNANAVERLRKRFSEQAEKWVAVEQWHDDADDMHELNALLTVADILRRGGISTVVTPMVE